MDKCKNPHGGVVIPYGITKMLWGFPFPPGGEAGDRSKDQPEKILKGSGKGNGKV